MTTADIVSEFELWNRDQAFSGTFSIRENGIAVFERAYGFANLFEKTPNRPSTRMGIASGTKLFTALAVLVLADRGAVAMERRIGDILKIELGKIDPNITIKQLLTHTSGIADYFDEAAGDDYGKLWERHPANTMTEPAAFLPLFADKPMKSAPGRVTAYSNSGFILLGLVIESATGLRYQEAVTELVVKPCLLRDTGFFYSDSLPANSALGYFFDDYRRTWRSNVFSIPIVGGPDGGIYTTVGDIAGLWERIIHGKLLMPETRKTMLSPRTRMESDGQGVFYGLGLYLFKRGDGTFDYYIIGGDPGVEFFSLSQPKAARVVTAIGNTGKDTGPLLRKIRGE